MIRETTLDRSIPFVRMDVTFADDPLCRSSLALYVAGCPRRCRGCHNEELQSPDAGTLTEVDFIVQSMKEVASADFIKAAVFSGGDWMLYPEAYVEIAGACRKFGLSTVLYTGELYEDLSQRVRDASDWVIDGPFEEGREGIFPPSTNQHVFMNGNLVDDVKDLPIYRHASEQHLAGIVGGSEE